MSEHVNTLKNYTIKNHLRIYTYMSGRDTMPMQVDIEWLGLSLAPQMCWQLQIPKCGKLNWIIHSKGSLYSLYPTTTKKDFITLSVSINLELILHKKPKCWSMAYFNFLCTHTLLTCTFLCISSDIYVNILRESI